jgi:hypothetical protein
MPVNTEPVKEVNQTVDANVIGLVERLAWMLENSKYPVQELRTIVGEGMSSIVNKHPAKFTTTQWSIYRLFNR